MHQYPVAVIQGLEAQTDGVLAAGAALADGGHLVQAVLSDQVAAALEVGG